MSASPLTDPVVWLRPGLLADLGEASAASLAARIGWRDVESLHRALSGEPCSVGLVCALVEHYLVVPFAYFATTAAAA